MSSHSVGWRLWEYLTDDLMKQKILALLEAHRIMTIATLRPDGWPQATTVGYVNEDLTLWFLCGLESQKATNLAHDSRVSITIDHDTPDIMSIKGLSMAARAHRVRDLAEAEKVIRIAAEVHRRAARDRTDEDAHAGGSRALSGRSGDRLRARLHEGLWPHRSRDMPGRRRSGRERAIGQWSLLPGTANPRRPRHEGES